ncbi:unnamed protein product [Heligmosomoides polygyrus]|uniref:Aminoacyl-tRNA hydrolase n=1 Tax=Heligmosomoides polygyrus TaxID=6339 RepID=A0A183F9E2_HELPZ|nr:unnamed protein product [Heligmosomoides polygyrus]
MDQYLWLSDRTAQFDRYQRNPMGCRAQMAHVFSMACSALAAVKNAEDDRDSHWLHGQIPNLRAFPLQILTTIPDMPSEAGWTKGRPVIAWIDGAPSLTHLKVHKVTVLPVQRELVVILVAYH